MKILNKKFWHDYWTKKRIERWGSFFIGSFAVLLVFCADLDNIMKHKIIIMNVKQYNAYSFFQAKRIRQVIREAILEDSDTLLFLGARLTPQELEQLKHKRRLLIAKIKEFDDEKNPEGRKQLLQTAKDLEKEIETLSAHENFTSVATNLYQVAVVIASISLIILSPTLLTLSVVIGLVGGIFHINGLM